MDKSATSAGKRYRLTSIMILCLDIRNDTARLSLYRGVSESIAARLDCRYLTVCVCVKKGKKSFF